MGNREGCPYMAFHSLKIPRQPTDSPVGGHNRYPTHGFSRGILCPRHRKSPAPSKEAGPKI